MIINHSGIGMLSCPRRYQLRVLHKIKDPSAAPLALGSAVHSAIEQYHIKGRTLANYNVMNEADTACNKYGVAAGDRPKVAGAIQCTLGHVQRPLYNGDKPLVEVKLDEKISDDITFQGTIDEILLSNDKRKLIINDYKTTGYVTLAPVLEKYRYSIQVQYYMYGLRKWAEKYIPEEYRDLPLYGMYTIIPYNKSPVMVQHTSLVPPDDDAVADLIEKSMYLMQAVEMDHKAGTLAAPIGRAAGECKSCRFNNICHAKNVDLAIEQAEKEEYNPMTFR